MGILRILWFEVGFITKISAFGGENTKIFLALFRAFVIDFYCSGSG